MNAEHDFEYDPENMETDGEASEMAEDESWVAKEDEGIDQEDEGFREDEDVGEAAFTVGEAMDTESDIESDGEDEAEAMSASARLRADRERYAREAYARQIAADQRLEAERAAAAQRSLTERLRGIQIGGRTRVSSVGSLQGAGLVTAILPNGRRSRMRIIPTMAPVSEVNRLRAVVALNERRQASATATNSKAIASLAAAQAAAVKKLSEQQLKSDKELGKRIVQGYNRLDKRITTELTGGTGVLDKHGKRMGRLLRRQRMRSVMDSVLLATSAPFFAAYGDRVNPFGTNNLILTGSLLGWLLGGEAIDFFAGDSETLKSLATVWSYGAFLGNGATVFFLLDGKQHERFVAGVTSVTSPTNGKGTKVDLSQVVKKGSFDEFKSAPKHLVVATILSTTDVAGANAHDVRGIVGPDGFLTLFLDVPAGTAGPLDVAWIVDTQTTPTPTGTPVP